MEINDIRTINQFKGGSFSEYKLSEVKSACMNELERANIINSFSNMIEKRDNQLCQIDSSLCSTTNRN